jgi:hypothetical protein
VLAAVGGEQRGPGRRRAVGDRRDPPALEQGDRRQLRGRVAQHLLDDVLRHLLAGLGVLLAPAGGQPERLAEAGDLVAEQAGAEHDVLGVLDRQRARGAQPAGQPPPAQVLHRAHARRLRRLRRGRSGSRAVRGSTSSTSIPRRPSSIAAARPLGPPPATSTGTRAGGEEVTVAPRR